MEREESIDPTSIASPYAATKQSVLDALSDPAVNAIRLTVGKVTIKPRHFAAVTGLVRSGDIRVVFQPHLKSPVSLLPQCRYNPHLRTLALGFCTAGSIAEASLIIHEATHAVWHLEQLHALTSLAAETVACITRGIFLSTKMDANPRASLLVQDGILVDPILANALLLAERILSGNPIRDGDLADLQRSLIAHPEHGPRFLASVG